MLKFLRKYNKILLVFFGVFLMIAFLAPQAVQQLGQFTDAPVGTLDGETVMQSDLRSMNAELLALDSVTPLITQQILPFDRGSNRERELQWLLLTREAEQGGFYGSDGDGQSWLPDLAREIVRLQVQLLREQGQPISLTPEQEIEQSQQVLEVLLQQVSRARRPGIGPETEQEVFQILAKARGVVRLLNSVQNSPRLSGNRLATEATDRLSGMTADLLVLDARAFSQTMPAPSEAQIAEHFEAYRETARGTGDFGMGYRLPRGVTLEWLTIDRAAISAAIEIDPIDARRHYERNRTQFPADFAGERAAVLEVLTNKRADEILEGIDRFVRAEVLRSLTGVSKTGVYLDLPEDWDQKRVSYEALAQGIVSHVQSEEGISIPLPEVNRRVSDVLTAQELRQLPGIGQSRVRVGAAFPFFPSVAFSAKELDANPDVQVQVGVTAVEKPAENLLTNSRYYYRLLEAREEQAPSELDDALRERVVADLRAIAAFEMLSSELDVYEQSLARSDFATLLSDVLPEGTLPEVQEGISMRRAGANSFVPALRDPELTKVLVDQAYELNIYQPVEDQDAELAVVGGVSPRTLSVVIGQTTALQPLTSEIYNFQRNAIAGSLQQADFQAAISEIGEGPYSLTRLMERHNYVVSESESEE